MARLRDVARGAVAAGCVLAAVASVTAAGTDGSETVVDVQRVKVKEAKEPTLRFLKENRDFFRARLDELRVLEGANRQRAARDLDPRFLRLRAMLEEIRAAQDSAAAGEAWIRERGLLDGVEELAELEREMDVMERLLDAQGDRLATLEEDFVGRQKTTLVVLLTGVSPAGAPAAVVLRDDDGGSARVSLSDAERESIARGGTAELLHELVEPRPHVWEVSFEGEGWVGRDPWELALEPERDRLTFVELDLAGVEPGEAGAGVTARTWTR